MTEYRSWGHFKYSNKYGSLSHLEYPSRWFNYVKKSPEWKEGVDYRKTPYGWEYSIEKVKKEVNLRLLKKRQWEIEKLKEQAKETEKEINKIKRQLSRKTTELKKKTNEIEKHYNNLVELQKDFL